MITLFPVTQYYRTPLTIPLDIANQVLSNDNTEVVHVCNCVVRTHHLAKTAFWVLYVLPVSAICLALFQ